MRASIISFTEQGGRLAERIRRALPEFTCSLYALPKFAEILGQIPVNGGLSGWCREVWNTEQLLVFVGASGIAVRLIAPLVSSKTTDPAVLVADEQGSFVISLLSGHLGGGNGFAGLLSERISAIPVITTATDVERRFSVDTFAAVNRLQISSMTLAKDISAAILAGEQVAFVTDETVTLQGKFPPELTRLSMEEAESWQDYMIVISVSKWPVHTGKILWLIPKTVTLGVGCRRDQQPEVVAWQTDHWLSAAGLFPESLCRIATIDLKKEEPALLRLAQRWEVPLVTFPAAKLLEAEGQFASSSFVKQVAGVDNVCERAAVLGSRQGILLMEKQAGSGVTAAAAAELTVVRMV